MIFNRRRFLLTGAGAAAAAPLVPAAALAGAGPLPDFAAWKDPDALIVHTPEILETRREAMGAPPITPASELYVRNSLPAPLASITEDPDAWNIEFGGVAEPGAMTLGALKGLGIESVVAVLQCAGNGRAFFEHEPGGTPWRVGAAGNVVWTGVPLRRVIDAMGGAEIPAGYVTATGGEALPEGADPLGVIVERSVPMEALEDALLAYEMNGAPLPLAHGGPVRLVVPGYYGVNNIKYVKRVALTTDESPAQMQQSRYRMRPVGERGASTQPSMYEMVVKSWVTAPILDRAAGRVLIVGVAMGGNSPVASVELSTDGGARWQAADLTGPDMGRFAWRPFAFLADLEPGTHVIASRARNDAGEEQPESVAPNEGGYGHNGWRAHAIELTIA
ncbi:MAG: sulfite oxidase [Pseudomonadota bacterium]